MILKQLIPTSIKLKYRQLKRWQNDKKQGYQFAQIINETEKNKISLPYNMELSQIIKPSYLYLNKVHNLRFGGKKIQQVFIRPNEVFSFWKILGQPNKKNGYKKGRNIINNKLTEDYGGGLCQLSGIIYHLALMANLKIVERYNHSKDIYTEESRFSPLGCDATVVFGYKDLRIYNNTKGIIQFEFDVNEDKIRIKLNSEKPIESTNLHFNLTEKHDTKKMIICNNELEVVSQSVYKKL